MTERFISPSVRHSFFPDTPIDSVLSLHSFFHILFLSGSFLPSSAGSHSRFSLQLALLAVGSTPFFSSSPTFTAIGFERQNHNTHFSFISNYTTSLHPSKHSQRSVQRPISHMYVLFPPTTTQKTCTTKTLSYESDFFFLQQKGWKEQDSRVHRHKPHKKELLVACQKRYTKQQLRARPQPRCPHRRQQERRRDSQGPRLPRAGAAGRVRKSACRWTSLGRLWRRTRR